MARIFHDWIREYADEVAGWVEGLPREKIAAKLGAAFAHVAERQREASGTMKHTKAVAWDTVALGSAPDDVIAKQLNRHRSAVAAARIKRGIPPFCGRGRPKKVKPNADS